MAETRRRRPQARHEHPDEQLARHVATIEAALLEQALTEDAAAGLVPSWARRGLHPHELVARVSFAAIDQHQALTAGQITVRLEDDREAFLRLLIADLEQQPSGRAVVDRLMALETAGLVQLAGAAELLTAAQASHLQALVAHADTAAGIAAAEAALQGVELGPVVLDVATIGHLEQLATRLAVAPHVDLLRALRDEAVRLPTPGTAGPLVAVLADHGWGLSVAPLEDGARSAVAQADGLGRQAVTTGPAAVAPAQVYASELLDGNTCGPCSFVDGTRYASVAEARLDYPVGNYVRCEGGARCRGTLVFVWASELPPDL